MEFLYHERQFGALCGQHCLNNLVQGQQFSAVQLAEIAAELDEREKSLMREGTATEQAAFFRDWKSSNVDESGNFSVDVLRVALSRPPVELDLVPIDDESLRNEGGDAGDSGGGGVRGRQAFVLNHMEHWFTVRQHASGSWWNLNSMLPRPEPISEFALDAFLAAMKQDGYSVFVVRGTMPAPAQPYSCGAQDGSEWHRAADLLGGNGGSAAGGAPVTTPDPWASAGQGQRLDGRQVGQATGGSGAGAGQSTAVGDSSFDEDDAMLQLALQQSREEQQARQRQQEPVAVEAAVAVPPATTTAVGAGDQEGSHGEDDAEALRAAIALSMSATPSPAPAPTLVAAAAALPPLPEEPAAGTTATAVARIQLVLPTGRRVVRRFPRDSPVTALWAWLQEQDEMKDAGCEMARCALRTQPLPGQPAVVLHLPELLEAAAAAGSTAQTLEQAGLVPSVSLSVKINE